MSEQKIYEVEVLMESYTTVTRYATEDQWDRDDTSTSRSLRGIRYPVLNRWAETISVGFEPQEEVPYYLVWAQYSTADSFGCDEGGGLELVGLYQDRVIAEENARRIEAQASLYNKLERSYGLYGLSKEEKAELNKMKKTFSPYSVVLLTDEGEEYEIHVPWNGYFERLNFVEADIVYL